MTDNSSQSSKPEELLKPDLNDIIKAREVEDWLKGQELSPGTFVALFSSEWFLTNFTQYGKDYVQNVINHVVMADRQRFIDELKNQLVHQLQNQKIASQIQLPGIQRPTMSLHEPTCNVMFNACVALMKQFEPPLVQLNVAGSESAGQPEGVSFVVQGSH